MGPFVPFRADDLEYSDDDSIECPPTPEPPRPKSKLFSTGSAKNSSTAISKVTRRLFPDHLDVPERGVSEKMRGIMVDWLVEVGELYELSCGTLFLTVSYIDIFLSTHQAILRNQIQLLAVSCLLIASKHEEDKTPPTVKDLCYITNDSYTPDEVTCMEKLILVTFKFDISKPTAFTFLRKLLELLKEIYSHSGHFDSIPISEAHLEFMASYLLELTLLDKRCEQFSPSLTAASALFLSRFTIDPKTHPWSSMLQCYTGFKPYELKDCVIIMRELQIMEDAKGSNSVRVVREKYKNKFAGAIFQSPEIPASYFDPIEWFSQDEAFNTTIMDVDFPLDPFEFDV